MAHALEPLGPWLKPAAHLFMALPLLWLAFAWAELLLWDPVSLRITAEPIAYTHNNLGLMALKALLLALAVTPVRILTGWGRVMTVRRALGLWAFAYAVLHLLAFLWLDLDWSLPELVAETLERPFILAGMLAFLAMLPLAVTSTNRAIRRLGARRWRVLHRLAYLAALAGVVHFVLRVKGWQAEPLIYAAILFVLLAIRLLPPLRRRITATA
ncbi:MAG: sulfite oxidase heme-binding subunit YedZ [Thermaurantiacus sp.]